MDWTEGRIKGFIVAVLRAGARRWPPKYETLAEAYVGQEVNKKTGRMAKHYRCNQCQGHFTSKDVQVDHINPVVDPDQGFVDWNVFIDRLFCSKENLQVLCTLCHREKTNNEKKKSNVRKKRKDQS